MSARRRGRFEQGRNVQVAMKRSKAMKKNAWTVAEAKVRLSEVIEKAHTVGPQRITHNGKVAAVVVSADEWKRETKRKGSLAEFLLASPLKGSDLRVERGR